MRRPAFLAFYLLARNGERPSAIGVDASQPGRDLLRGAGLAALIGGAGLGLYYLAFKAGISLHIVAASLPDVWWRFPVLRGSYHLHQGIGPFLGNVVMGVIFATLFVRWRRTNPMIIAHTLINAVAFVGYTLLAGHVSWLP
jgi:hypothetical protein